MKDRIRFNPDKALRRKAQSIRCTPLDFLRVANMFKLMYRSNGIGLAAPQIGWDARVFVLDVKDENSGQLVFINPKILDRTGGIIEMTEGCLSVPGFLGAVDRHDSVYIEATNLKGQLFKVQAEGLTARCIMHEYDHLEGILFIDKAKKLYRAGEDEAQI